MKHLFYLIAFVLVFNFTSCKKKDKEEQPEQPQEEHVDAALMRIDIPSISINGDVITVKGLIQNFEDDPVTSLEIKWQVDNGAEHTATFDNLNIPKLGTYEFTHPETYTAASGSHTIKVWISDVNGNGDDERPANNLLTKNFSVASQSVQKTVLYEEFTSSTCGPCATFNTNYFNESFLQANAGKFTLVKYQMNWPGNGDPYYTAEGGTRRQYYGVNGVPTLFIDGKEGTDFDTNDLQTKLDEHYAMPGVVQLQAYYEIDAQNNVKVKVVGTPYLSGQFTLHIAVVEKETTQNAATNGETRFFNVMMKMVPDANGTTINATDGTPFVERKSASLNGTNIEEYSDLEVVVFIQDDTTKFVLQSVKAVLDPSQIDF